MNIPGWLRRVFVRRQPDPDLAAVRDQHAKIVGEVSATAARATDVAARVARDPSNAMAMRGSFARASGRLSR